MGVENLKMVNLGKEWLKFDNFASLVLKKGINLLNNISSYCLDHEHVKIERNGRLVAEKWT